MTSTSTTLRAFVLMPIVTMLIPGVAAARQSGPIPNEKIFAALGVREGMTVCEMGAGDGDLSIAAARLVGPSGRVYTSELGDDRVKSLRGKIESSRLSQISVVAGDASKTNFADGTCDGLFMRSVYHQFADPSVMNASIAAALKPGARLVIVDFTPPPGNEAACPADRGKDGMHGITAPTLSRQLTDAGFQPVTSETIQRSIIVVVSKPRQ